MVAANRKAKTASPVAGSVVETRQNDQADEEENQNQQVHYDRHYAPSSGKILNQPKYT